MTRPERTFYPLAAITPGPATGRARGKDDFLEQLQSKPLDALQAAVSTLTHQEQVVLEFIVRGACNKDICNTLGIEITTAKAHTSRIFRKLGVKNRVQAAVFGLWTSLLARAATEDASPVVRHAEVDHNGTTRATTAIASAVISAGPMPQ